MDKSRRTVDNCECQASTQPATLPAVLAQERAPAFHLHRRAETPRDALRDATHGDRSHYSACSTVSDAEAVMLSRLVSGTVLRSRMSMVTLPLLITRP